MAVIQNNRLRMVAEAYKATLIGDLHAETMMRAMQEHLGPSQAKTRSCLGISGQAAFLRKQCKQFATKIRKRRVDTAPKLPGIRKLNGH